MFQASVTISFHVPRDGEILFVARFEGLNTIPHVVSSSDSRGLVCPEA